MDTSSVALRTLDILEHLGRAKQPQRLKDIALAVGLPTTTTNRLLNSLVLRGYARQQPTDLCYTTGWKLVLLAGTVKNEAYLVNSIHGHVQELANQVLHSVNVAVLQNDHVLLLDCVLPTVPVDTHYNSPGLLLPAHATALGKVLLANLPPEERDPLYQRPDLQGFTPSTVTELSQLLDALEQVRQQGYALDQGEYNAERKCVAAPITDADGVAHAAVSVTLTTNEWSVERQTEIMRAIVKTARDASAAAMGLPNTGRQ